MLSSGLYLQVGTDDVKRRDILRVNRRILLRVGADECAILFMPKILGTSGEKRLNEAKG